MGKPLLEEESPQCQPPHHAYSSRSQHPREQSNTASIRTTIASRDGGTSGSPGSTSANVSNQTLRHSGGDTTVSFMAQPVLEAIQYHHPITRDALHTFIGTLQRDGTGLAYFSPGSVVHGDEIAYVFNPRNLQHALRTTQQEEYQLALQGSTVHNEDYMGFEAIEPLAGQTTSNRRRSKGTEHRSPHHNRKRPRSRQSADQQHVAIPTSVTTRRSIRIGDAEAVRAFYLQSFIDVQQQACKIIAKAWIKAVEPRKQSFHPYTKSDPYSPEWWPDGVKHREPDHLKKEPRVALLSHMIDCVLEPKERQYKSFREAGLNIRKFEELCLDSLAPYFAAKRENAEKRPYMVDLFRVAKKDERFRRDEIDASTEVFLATEASQLQKDDQEQYGGLWDDDEHDTQVRQLSDGYRELGPRNSASYLPPSEFPSELLMESEHNRVTTSDVRNLSSTQSRGGGRALTTEQFPKTNGLPFRYQPAGHILQPQYSNMPAYSGYAGGVAGDGFANNWSTTSEFPGSTVVYTAYSSQPAEQSPHGLPYEYSAGPTSANSSYMSTFTDTPSDQYVQHPSEAFPSGLMQEIHGPAQRTYPDYLRHSSPHQRQNQRRRRA